MSDFPYNNIVILTGAGISAESGIQTFRSEDGLWENEHVEDVATPEGYLRNPEFVQRFYNGLRCNLQSPQITPNAAHLALAKLEKEFSGTVNVVTQNVDNLHERAGSHNILHMHGELLTSRCIASGKTYRCLDELHEGDLCACCQPAQQLRPNIVWFGEMPLYMDEIDRLLKACDLFIAIGTSGVVYPAAGFVQQAAEYGAKTVEINLEPSAVQSQFEQKIYGSASHMVPQFVQTLLV